MTRTTFAFIGSATAALALMAGCGAPASSLRTPQQTSALAVRAVPQTDWEVRLWVNGAQADYFSARQNSRVTVKAVLEGSAPEGVTYKWQALGGMLDRRDGQEVRWWLDWPASSQLEVTATAPDGSRRTHRTVALIQAIPTPPPPPYIPMPPLPIKP
ncbi:MAG: hypothetical protein VKP57_06315 [Candidatus Sericytochromatia bacterium]|nr:hypothetical protein [Candidatus Sericytochromatia bacterium]